MPRIPFTIEHLSKIDNKVSAVDASEQSSPETEFLRLLIDAIKSKPLNKNSSERGFSIKTNTLCEELSDPLDSEEVRLFAGIYGNPKHFLNKKYSEQLDAYINLRKAQVDVGLNLRESQDEGDVDIYFHKSDLLEEIDSSESKPIIYALGMTQCAMMADHIFGAKVTAHFDIVYKLITGKYPSSKVKHPDLLAYSNPSSDYSKSARLLIEAKGRRNNAFKEAAKEATGQLFAIDELLNADGISGSKRKTVKSLIEGTIPVISVAYFDDPEDVNCDRGGRTGKTQAWMNRTYFPTAASLYASGPDNPPSPTPSGPDNPPSPTPSGPDNPPSPTPLRGEKFGGLLLIAHLLPICQIIKDNNSQYNEKLTWAFIPKLEAGLILPTEIYNTIVNNFCDSPLPDCRKLFEHATKVWDLFCNLDIDANKKELDHIGAKLSAAGLAWISEKSLGAPSKNGSHTVSDNALRDALNDLFETATTDAHQSSPEESTRNNEPNTRGIKVCDDLWNSETLADTSIIYDDESDSEERNQEDNYMNGGAS